MSIAVSACAVYWFMPAAIGCAAPIPAVGTAAADLVDGPSLPSSCSREDAAAERRGQRESARVCEGVKRKVWVVSAEARSTDAVPQPPLGWGALCRRG